MSGIDSRPVERLPERARWRLSLIVLCLPLLLAIILGVTGTHPVLPRTRSQLVWFSLLELLLWGTVFIAAFRISGISASQLRLKAKHPLRTIAFGVLWFVLIELTTYFLFWAVSRWIGPSTSWATDEKVAAFTDARNISHHLRLSIVAFSLASLTGGFTEELWRAGMLAGMKTLFPWLRTLPSILLIAVLFGLGHLYQGWFGVAEATVGGIFLGLVLAYRNSYWEAAIAHTLFDAFASALAITMMLNVHVFDPQIVYDAAKGDLTKVKHWVQMGADVNATYDAAKDWKNITVLEDAAGRSNSEVVRYLLEEGANPNLADSRGQTPLIAAAQQNRLTNVQLLVAHGAKINVQDNRGFTALRYAAEYNRLEIARVLIDSGADVNIRDKEGLSPLAAAMKYRYDDLKNLLQQNGGK